MARLLIPVRRISLQFNRLLEYSYCEFWKILAFIFFGFPFLGEFLSRRWFWKEKGAIILVYHELGASAFRRHLEYIKNHWKVVSLDDLLTQMKQGKPLTRAIIFTFDDGYKSNYTEIFPLLLKHQTPITLYLVSGMIDADGEFWWQSLENLRRTAGKKEAIPTPEHLKSLPEEQRKREISNLLGRYSYRNKERSTLTLSEAKEMVDSGLVTIGAHTRNHPCLTKVGLEEAEDEMKSSKKDLESAFGVPVVHFSYPNGDYINAHVSLCEKSGYSTAVTAVPGVNTPTTNPYELRRILIRPDDTVQVLALKITGLGHRLGLDHFTFKHLRQRGVPC
jgi:peptidoglycan/xylan/chitin deacetylase (PgdA/CDA1 family)